MRMISIGECYQVPEPNSTDIHNHSFTGIVIGIRNGYAQVQDADGDVFEIEPERLLSNP